MSGSNGKAPPDIRTIPALRELIAAVDGRRTQLDGLLAEKAAYERKIAELEPALDPDRALRADRIKQVVAGGSAADVVADADAEERRRSRAAVRKMRDLVASALPECEKLLAVEQTRLDEAASVAPEVINPFRGLERETVLVAILLGKKYDATVAYGDGMRAQGVTLPTLNFPAIGSLRRPTEGGLVPELVLAGLELGLIEASDVPDSADPYVRVKGAEVRAERERPVPPPPAPAKPPEKKQPFVHTFSHIGKLRGRL